jgi:hypothetical protein
VEPLALFAQVAVPLQTWQPVQMATPPPTHWPLVLHVLP